MAPMYSYAVLFKSPNTIVLALSVYHGTMQRNCLVPVHVQTKANTGNQKLNIHPGCLKAQKTIL
jgi:hypothetical protein